MTVTRDPSTGQRKIAALLLISILIIFALSQVYSENIGDVTTSILHPDAVYADNVIVIPNTEHSQENRTVAESWVAMVKYDAVSHQIIGTDHKYLPVCSAPSVVDCENFRDEGETYGGAIESMYGPGHEATANMTLWNDDLDTALLHRNETTTTERIYFYVSGDETLSPRTLYLELRVDATTNWVRLIIT